MARAKQASKQKRRKIVLPAWGAAGMSLAMAGGASAAVAPTANAPSHGMVLPPVVTLGEEELTDVSLATFYVYDKESAEAPQGVQFARVGCGGCRGGCGGGCRCGGRCARGCGCRCAGGCGCACGPCAGCTCSCCLSWGACQLC